MKSFNKADFYASIQSEFEAFSLQQTNLSAQKQKLCDLLDHNPNWSFVGFYDIQTHPELGKCLHIGEFKSEAVKPCPWIQIGNGVCGTAVKTEKNQIVPDVTKLDNYIACDDQTLSELVIPLFKDDTIWTVLDLDSPAKQCFSEEDVEALNKLLSMLNYK